ncbi:MAG: glycosyltransferase [Pseudomonadota bacterium]
MTVAVIIPFFQRQDGILRRGLESVFAQSHQDLRVIIVDDASPHPAKSELAPLPKPQQDRITVVEQSNTGPGGARNAGLDALSGRDTAAAFLDSDDIWDVGHLDRAMRALTEHGADLYLAAIGGDEAFDYHADMRAVLDQWPHAICAEDPPLFEIEALGERMLSDWSFMHLSSMVMAPALAASVRFEPALRLAAEDVLFFADAVRLASRTLVSTAPGAVRGHGDNLFHGVDNTADKFLSQQFCVWSAFRMLRHRAPLSAEATSLLRRRQGKARKQALWGQMARRRAGKPVQLGGLAGWSIQDPGLLGAVVALALGRGGDDADLV